LQLFVLIKRLSCSAELGWRHFSIQIEFGIVSSDEVWHYSLREST